MAGAASVLVVLLMLCASAAVAAFALFALNQGWLDGPGGGISGPPGGTAVVTDDATVKTLAGRLTTNANDYLAHITGSGGDWVADDKDWWTAGFMTGCWRRMAQLTGDAKWTKLADDATQKLAHWQTHTTSHNIGFVIMLTYGLAPSPSADALTTAAGTMAKRFQPALGLFKSRDNKKDPLTVTMDNMMTLALLWEAAKRGGNQEWADMAEKHARTAIDLFVRDDGSTVHWCQFTDPKKLSSVVKKTHQGSSDDSAWSRGQAWAMYGWTQAYEYTQNAAFLNAAKKVTKYYLDNAPDDGVPYWDFQPGSKKYKDTSAAAVAACALFKLAKATGDAGYRTSAKAILATLLASYSGASKNLKSLLCCACISVPAGIGVNTGYVVSDYYLLEGLMLARAAA